MADKRAKLDTDIGVPIHRADERGVFGATVTTVDAHPEGERAGLYLAVLVAVAVPALIVLALFLPSPDPASADREISETPSSGLDRVELSTDS